MLQRLSTGLYTAHPQATERNSSSTNIAVAKCNRAVFPGARGPPAAGRAGGRAPAGGPLGPSRSPAPPRRSAGSPRGDASAAGNLAPTADPPGGAMSEQDASPERFPRDRREHGGASQYI